VYGLHHQREDVFGGGFFRNFLFTDSGLRSGMQNLLSGTYQIIGAQVESIGGTGGGFGASANRSQATDDDGVLYRFRRRNSADVHTLSSLNPSSSAGGTPDLPTGFPDTGAGDGTFSAQAGFLCRTGDIESGRRLSSYLVSAWLATGNCSARRMPGASAPLRSRLGESCERRPLRERIPPHSESVM